MNKKQVGAFLKVISKDEHRPVLMHMIVSEYLDELYLVGTNGYVLAAVKIDDDAEALKGRMIHRTALERWYKLATGKSRLTGDELIGVSSDDYAQSGKYADGTYPNWQGLVPEPYRKPADSIAFNASFMKDLQDVDGSEAMTWEIGGELEPVVARTERGLYIFMPKRK